MKTSKNTSIPKAVCGAKIIKIDAFCIREALANGRCYIHGGLSTGAKTTEGLAAIKKAVITHGKYTKKAKDARAKLREFLKEIKMVIS